jgi:small-conductance mechanosensitive channel
MFTSLFCPLIFGFGVLAFDLLLWHLTPPAQKLRRMLVRVTLLLTYTWVVLSAGVSPLQAAPWPDDVGLNVMGTILGVLWWFFTARTLTVVLTSLFFPRTGLAGALFQDIVSAAIFLIAIIAAAGYVMQLPVKGLLATSGGMAIIGGLALRSTLSDLFSGIVLNTTKSYQVDDYILVDGIEGKVTDIDWRATHLMTRQGSMAVIPNSVMSAVKILNLSRPLDVHGVSVTVQVPARVRPGKVLEALEKAMQGTRALLATPAFKASIKSAGPEYIEYEARGFIATLAERTSVCNHLFDLAHRHLEASGVILGNGLSTPGLSRERLLLDDLKIFRSLRSEERDALAAAMVAVEYHADQVVLELNEVSDFLMVINAGVISASVHDGERLIEAARMGPGEVLGEEGILAEGRSRAQFRCITRCVLFRIDQATLRSYLECSTELKAELNKLQLFRQGVRQTLVFQKPAEIKKGGFLRWLKPA